MLPGDECCHRQRQCEVKMARNAVPAALPDSGRYVWRLPALCLATYAFIHAPLHAPDVRAADVIHYRSAREAQSKLRSCSAK